MHGVRSAVQNERARRRNGNLLKLIFKGKIAAFFVFFFENPASEKVGAEASGSDTV